MKQKAILLSPYCESAAIVVLLMAIHRPFAGLIEERSWFFLLQIGTCYSVWRGGLFPGLFSLVASSLASAYFYLPPDLSFAISNQADIVSLMVYIVLGLVIVGFGNSHYTERQRVIARNKELLIANEQLIDHNSKLDQSLQAKTNDLQEIGNWASNLPK